jgi:hypothetical protein
MSVFGPALAPLFSKGKKDSRERSELLKIKLVG